MKSKRLFITAAAVLVAVFVVAALVYQNQKADSARALARLPLLDRPYAPVEGSRSAKVSIVEFLDPACDTCRDFYPMVKRMMTDNPDKIRVTIRYAPFHPNSDYVVKVIEAARLQGRWQEALEALLAAQPGWAPNHRPQPDLVWNYLGGLGLDLEQARKDMNSPTIAKHLAQDIADAKALNVTQTPEFFVNGKPLPSFGYEQLATLVNDELKSAYR
jgi:protein-disulfide isomerase